MGQRSILGRTATWLAGIIAVLVAVLLPLDNFLDSYQHTVGSLITEAEINSRIISHVINDNPELWRYEQMRLEEVLTRRPRSGEKELRRIIDLHGTVVAESDDHLDPPLIQRSFDLQDSGVPIAKIEISRSLRPLLVQSALFALFGICIGLIIFFAVRILPFRAVIQAERLLRESKEGFESFFNLLPELACVASTEGHFKKLNLVWQEKLGYGIKELQERSFVDFVHPEDVELTMDEMKKQLAGGLTDNFVNRYRCKDGSYRWLEWRARAVNNATLIYATARDITDRKQVEEALAREQGFIRTLLDDLADGVVACDVDGNLNVINRTAREWHGMDSAAVSPEQWPGYFNHLYEPDGRTPLSLASIPLMRAFHGECVRNAELKIMAPGLPPRDILASGDPLRGINHHKLGAVVVLRDVTEQRQMLKALVAAETKYRGLLENIQLVAVMLDCTGTITFCNKYFLDLTAWSREEVLGSDFFDLFISEEARDRLKSAYGQYIAGKSPHHYEGEIVTRDGATRLVMWNNSFLWDSEGNIAGVATIGTDVTEKRHLEEQLRQSQKMEAIGTLAGGIAHDFNNILTVIMGYAYLILDSDEGDDTKHMAAEIISSANRAEEMTKSLLAFSRKQTLELIPVDINDIVREVAKNLSRLIREDVEVRIELSDNPLAAMADRWQIEQVIINLSVNARDAMPKGGTLTIATNEIEVSGGDVDLYEVAMPGRYGLIQVADTGSGMDKKTAKRIFEPFFTTKEVGKGTGLGLSMVYGAVKKHDGHVTVYSEPGQGTTFKIYLPLLESLPRNDLGAGEEILPNGSETILLVEDDEAIRHMTKQMLENHGYHVLVAVDGEEAVSVFREHQDSIRLILTDVIMPRKNGREALDDIVAIKPGVPAIFMSGYSADFMTQRGVVKDKANYVTKPLKPALLLNRMRELLALQGGNGLDQSGRAAAGGVTPENAT